MFVKKVPFFGWVIVGIVLTALVIFKISESKGHPGYPKEAVLAPEVTPAK